MIESREAESRGKTRTEALLKLIGDNPIAVAVYWDRAEQKLALAIPCDMPSCAIDSVVEMFHDAKSRAPQCAHDDHGDAVH